MLRTVCPGDWILVSEKGVTHLCDDEMFHQKYEQIE